VGDDVAVVGAAHRFVDDFRRKSGIVRISALDLEVERPRRVWKEGLIATKAVLSSRLAKQVNERLKGPIFILLNSEIKI